MPKPIPPQRSGVVVPHSAKWHQRLAAAVIVALVRLVSSTIRIQWHDTMQLRNLDTSQTMVFCVWHNRLALCMDVFRFFQRQMKQPRKLAAMVSASKDGGLLARVLELNGVQPVRGSSSRRGRQAMLELVSWAERGYDLAITPDGPRGPCYRVQEGVIALGQVTGRPIVAVSYHITRKITLKSWDRFQIPLPFSRCIVRLAAPVLVPREATEEQREAIRVEVERRLQEMNVD